MARPAPDAKKRTVPGLRFARGVRVMRWLRTAAGVVGWAVLLAWLGELAHTGDPAEFRARVDDVRGERGQCVRRMSDGRICGLRAASCPDCGPAVHDMPQGA